MKKKEVTKSRFVGHIGCNICGSSDGVGVYEQGPATCFVCGEPHKNPLEEGMSVSEITSINGLAFKKENEMSSESNKKESLDAISNLNYRGFKERGLPKVVTEFYEVKAKEGKLLPDGNPPEIVGHCYPYGKSEITGYKVRTLPKDFTVVGSLQGLFGQRLFSGSGRRIVITEGEIDTLSVAYAMYKHYNQFYPVVGLPSSSSKQLLVDNREWLRGYQEIILMLDNDAAGQKATEQACKILGIDKVKIAHLKENDANEELIKHGWKDLCRAVWDAKSWCPANILAGESLWEQFVQQESKEALPFPECIQGVNEKTKGARLGEIDLFISGTGSGKSTVTREILLGFHETCPDQLGVIPLEESPGEYVKKLLQMEVGKDFEEENVEEAEKRAAFEKLFNDERIKVLDHQGSVSDDSLMEKIETLCAMGCKYIILDHLTIAVSEAEGDQNSAVDKVMSDLLKLVKRHNVWLGLISHLRKTSTNGVPFEEGKMPSLDDIKGSGSVKQISFQIIAFARNMTASSEIDRNKIKVRVLKNRFNGKTGDAGGALYSPETNRLSYLDTEFEAEPKLIAEK